MRKLTTLVLLAAVSLPLLAGCARGDAWYYPYGPPYFGGKNVGKEPQTVESFIGGKRPQ